MRAALAFLMSPVYPGALGPEHRADLLRSGLSAEAISASGIRSVPPSMIGQLLGFDNTAIRSAMLIPFYDLETGALLDHVRMKIFPPLTSENGTIKYFQPKGSGARLYFPPMSRMAILDPAVPLWLVEGEKKALAAAQLGRAAVGFSGIENWHLKGSRVLLPDFDLIPLADRLVESVPDGDVQTNPNVRRGAERFAEALTRRGARVQLVCLPTQEIPA